MNKEQIVNKRKEIINKSEELHKAIIKIGIKKGVFSAGISEKEIKNRYVDIFDVLPDNIASSILVLSINPSSSDIDKGETPSSCYLHYIPKEIKLLRPDLTKDTIEGKRVNASVILVILEEYTNCSRKQIITPYMFQVSLMKTG